MKKICLDNSVVNRIKIESPEEMKTSFFKEEYEKANVQLKDIIRLQKNNKEKNQSIRDNDCLKKNYTEDDDINNNIIAFIGERGSGKSSAMLSFKGKILSKGIDNETKEFSNVNFYAIDNIDPSIMNKNDSIIEIIVGQMFKKYKDACKNKHSLYERHLVNCFEKVFSDLKLLNDDYKYSEIGDDLENLINISSAVSLHNNFRELVENYLKYIDENESKKNNYLLISIDDLDLNLSAAQLMLEDIRKFLIQDNIIILMAIKLEQLEEVLIQKNINDLKIYEENYICKLEDKEVKDKFLNDIRNKAIKYLEKILPYNIRIILPKVDVDDVEIDFKDEFEGLDDYKKETKNKLLKETMVNIYFKKYRYIIGSDAHLKEIMPSNLRGWIQLFDFLSKEELKEKQLDNKEEVIDKDEESKENYLNNLYNLKKYYISHVEKEVESIVIKNNLLEFLNCPIGELNKKVFVFINDYIMKYVTIDENIETKQDELIIKDVIELNSRKHFILKENISLGDIISWIKLYENCMDSIEEVKVIEIIKLILSIRYLEIFYQKNGKYNLANVIGRDFSGRYFELVRNKHVGINRGNHFNRFCSYTERANMKNDYILFKGNLVDKILKSNGESVRKGDEIYVLSRRRFENILEGIELEKGEDSEISEQVNNLNRLLNMYFNLFEPQFQDQWKTRNSIFYRNEFSLNTDWRYKYKKLKKYMFKPLNIIGNQYLPYDENNNKDNVNSTIYVDPIILVININYFMDILNEFNTNINKTRPNNTPIAFLNKVIDQFNFTLQSKKDTFSEMIRLSDEKTLLECGQIDLLVEENEVEEEKIISKKFVEDFLKLNITYTTYRIMDGYSLDYDDFDEFFLYYNWDKLKDIEENNRNLNYEQMENNISTLKSNISEILGQTKIIKERIKNKKNETNKQRTSKKSETNSEFVLLNKVILEVENELKEINKEKNIEDVNLFNKKICDGVRKICDEIEKFDALQED